MFTYCSNFISLTGRVHCVYLEVAGVYRQTDPVSVIARRSRRRRHLPEPEIPPLEPFHLIEFDLCATEPPSTCCGLPRVTVRPPSPRDEQPRMEIVCDPSARWHSGRGARVTNVCASVRAPTGVCAAHSARGVAVLDLRELRREADGLGRRHSSFPG